MAKARPANAAERRHWAAILDLGCIVGPSLHCQGRLTIHHCGTGAGGRKNHMHVICLCEGHHQGPEGIDGQRMSKRGWQEKYGSEVNLMVRTQDRLDLQAKMMADMCYLGTTAVKIWVDEAGTIQQEHIDTILQHRNEGKTNV